jgi:hypothetical protein
MAQPVYPEAQGSSWNPRSIYEKWMGQQELPIYRGHAADLPSIELAPWADRDCSAGFLYFQGMEDIHEARIVKGRGLCTVWAGDREKKTFEWGDHAIFMIPPNYTYQLSNASGSQPARVMQTNYLPLALTACPNIDFFLNSPQVDLNHLYGVDTNLFSEATLTRPGGGDRRANAPQNLFVGNFLPDMATWDKLEPYYGRGAGGTTVYFRSRIAKGGHMSVFAPGSYKKAHRHGPGRVIVIPDGEGYTVVWPANSDQEKEVIPWREGTCFTPPEQWYHQHFNVGTVNARYIAFGPPPLLGGHAAVHGHQQIEYPEEEPWIRHKFEEELSKRGMTNVIPDEAYKDLNFEWDYGEEE